MTNKQKKKLRKEGYIACTQGLQYDDCPYPINTEERQHWFSGYDDCIEEDYLWMDI